MRLVTESDRLKPRLGESRLVSKFIWFPKKLGNEWRWLEKCIIRQEIVQIDVGGRYKYQWIDTEWSDTAC